MVSQLYHPSVSSYMKRTRGKKICENCKKEYDCVHTKQKYFSNACQKDFEYNQKIAEWKNSSIIDCALSISKYIKRYLFAKYDSKCSRCGWGEINPFTLRVPLDVEHIDGNYMNNSESNLTLLCPNCHSLTKTYKGANRGHGRHNRMQRYKAGISY